MVSWLPRAGDVNAAKRDQGRLDRNQHRHAPHALSAQASLWFKIQLIGMFVKVSHGKAFCIEGADLHVKEQLKDLIVILTGDIRVYTILWLCFVLMVTRFCLVIAEGCTNGQRRRSIAIIIQSVSTSSWLKIVSVGAGDSVHKPPQKTPVSELIGSASLCLWILCGPFN